MTYESELYHFGVKGMHWGIRKQNRDGTLTDRGRNKLNKSSRYQKKLVKQINKDTKYLAAWKYQDKVAPIWAKQKDYDHIKTRRDNMLNEFSKQQIALGKRKTNTVITAVGDLSLGYGVANGSATTNTGNTAVGSATSMGVGVGSSSKRVPITEYYLKKSK